MVSLVPAELQRLGAAKFPLGLGQQHSQKRADGGPLFRCEERGLILEALVSSQIVQPAEAGRQYNQSAADQFPCRGRLVQAVQEQRWKVVAIACRQQRAERRPPLKPEVTIESDPQPALQLELEMALFIFSGFRQQSQISGRRR